MDENHFILKKTWIALIDSVVTNWTLLVDGGDVLSSMVLKPKRSLRMFESTESMCLCVNGWFQNISLHQPSLELKIQVITDKFI